VTASTGFLVYRRTIVFHEAAVGNINISRSVVISLVVFSHISVVRRAEGHDMTRYVGREFIAGRSIAHDKGEGPDIGKDDSLSLGDVL